jgi:pimeloyl-ACP methyl ester carboxylesterase
MVRSVIAALALGLGLASAAAPGWTQPAAPVPQPKNDYADGKNWLCRPGRQDACAINLDTTVIAADGKMTREAFHADPDPRLDCFYVYPTVSTEAGGNSDMTVTAAETNVVQHQFARLASRCRLFAPMYRQVTLSALRGFMTGKPIPADRALAYGDVVAAWNQYLAHDNNGRGVILIGHSQGSGVLTQLIKNEIDGKPIQARVISAILMGTNLAVPKGQDVGGAFQHIPVCRSASQIGCVIAFADFRASAPPPANSRFGKVKEPGMVAACTNPSALGGGSGPVHAYMPARPFQWTNPAKPIDTMFVSVPGLMTGECVDDEHGSYLAITLHPTPGGARANDIPGDVVAMGQVQADWGLHLVDANLHMGALLDVVAAETKTYLAKAGH